MYRDREQLKCSYIQLIETCGAESHFVLHPHSLDFVPQIKRISLILQVGEIVCFTRHLRTFPLKLYYFLFALEQSLPMRQFSPVLPTPIALFLVFAALFSVQYSFQLIYHRACLWPLAVFLFQSAISMCPGFKFFIQCIQITLMHHDIAL